MIYLGSLEMPKALEDLIRSLRDGKVTLRRTRRSASLEDKIYALWRAQQMYVEIAASRRPLRPWERPWNIMSDVRESVIVEDGVVAVGKRETSSVSASRSHWVRPHRPWVLAG